MIFTFLRILLHRVFCLRLGTHVYKVFFFFAASSTSVAKTAPLLRYEPITTPPHRPKRPFRRHGRPVPGGARPCHAVTRGGARPCSSGPICERAREGVEVKGGG